MVEGVTPIVLIHGGGFDRRCWDRLIPNLEAPVVAVDLPGRGAHPAAPETVNFASCAAAVRDDIDAAGFGDVVLVGHSLAGCSLPAIVGLLGRRVRQTVFVACTVPADGQSAFDTLDPEVQTMIREAGEPAEPRPMDPTIARMVLGDDLDQEQFAWCVERLVAEVVSLTTDPVDLSPFRASSMKRIWIRTQLDIIVPPDKQLRFAENVGDCPVTDLAAGHMCMVSQPAALAAILNGLNPA
jgi:pimeloyl-ACP methyl ester carboxylesterase